MSQFQEKFAVGPVERTKETSSTVVDAIALLRCFTRREMLLGNKTLSEKLNLPPPTIARLTRTLCKLGLLSHDPAHRKYRLGYGVLTLGYPLLANLQERYIARRVMKELTDKTGGQTSMAALSGFEAIYLESYRPDPQWIEQPEIGTTRPVMDTAIGHALLFTLTPIHFEYLMKVQKSSNSKAYSKQRRQIETSFEMLETKGYCVARGTFQPTLHAIATPLHLEPGSETFAFNLSMRCPPGSKLKIESYAADLLSLRDHVRQSC